MYDILKSSVLENLAKGRGANFISGGGGSDGLDPALTLSCLNIESNHLFTV